MKHIFLIYFLFLSLFILSCKEKEYKAVANIDKKGISSNHKKSINIQNTSKVDLPFKFASFIFDTLENEIKYEELLSNIYSQNFPALTELLNKKIDNLEIKEIHKSTEEFAPLYYSMLLNDDAIKLTEPYIFKKLPSKNNNFEIVIAMTRINKKVDDFSEGLIFEIITYSLTDKNIINRKRLICAGLGSNDEYYYESFIINEKYNIFIKSYLTIEDESTVIKRKMKIDDFGKIIDVENKVERIDLQTEYEAPEGQ